jgi:hypothetical protein
VGASLRDSVTSCPLSRQPYCWVCFEVLDPDDDHAHGVQVHGDVFLEPNGKLKPEDVAAEHRKWRKAQAHELGRSLGLTAEEVDELVRRWEEDTGSQRRGSGDLEEELDLHNVGDRQSSDVNDSGVPFGWGRAWCSREHGQSDSHGNHC